VILGTPCRTIIRDIERNNGLCRIMADSLDGTAKPLFGGSNPPVASISTQTEEAPEKSGLVSL
jgi:hypothetical protein